MNRSNKLRTHRHSSWIGSMLVAGVLASSLLGGCSASTATQAPPTTSPTKQVTYNFQTPMLTSMAPTNIALGDTVVVYGSNFIDQAHGTLGLYMDGTFTDNQGNETRYTSADASGNPTPIPLSVSSNGQATFVFGPDIFFSPSGQDLGSFAGTFQVVSTLTAQAVNAQPGDQEISTPGQYTLTALPSVYMDQMRSIDATACDPVTAATTGTQNLAVGMHLIGMDDATADDPITYSITYDSSTILAAYVGNQQYGSWPFWGPTAPNTNASTNDGQSTFTITITDGTSILIDPQHSEQVVNVNPAVTINQQAVSTVKLAGFATAANATPGQQTVNITIQATRQSGASIRRSLTFPVWNQIELPKFSGTPVLKEYFAPELADVGAVLGSIPNGTDQTYHEGSSETKSRSVSMNWNIQNSQMLGLSVGGTVGFELGIPGIADGQTSVTLNANTSQTWSQTFGEDVNQTVSATLDMGTQISQHILPGMYGALYLQWARYEADVNVIYHSPCGVSGVVGTAALTDWKANYYPETSSQDPPPPVHAQPVGLVGSN